VHHSKFCSFYLASTSVTDKHELEGWDTRCRGFSHGVVCGRVVGELYERLLTGVASAVRQFAKSLRGARSEERTLQADVCSTEASFVMWSGGGGAN
jgi:hypothetical protein